MSLTPPPHRPILPATPLTINVPPPPTLNNMKGGAGMNPLAMPQVPAPPALNMPTLPSFGGKVATGTPIGNQIKSMIGQGLAREIGYATGLVKPPTAELTPEENAAKKKAQQDADIAAGVIKPPKPDTVPPPLKDPILENPDQWLPVSVEGVKTYFDHAGHKIDDATAQAFFDASSTQATPSLFFKDLPNQWANYAANKQATQAKIQQTQQASDTAKAAGTGYQDPNLAGALWQNTPQATGESGTGGTIPPPPSSAPPAPTFDPQTLADATTSIGGKADAANPTDIDKVSAVVMPALGPALQTLGTFGQTQMTKEAATEAQNFFQWIADKNLPIVSPSAKMGSDVSSWLVGKESRIGDIAKILGISEGDAQGLINTAKQARPPGMVGPLVGEQSATDVATAAGRLAKVPGRSGGLLTSPKATMLMFALSVIDTADKNGLSIPVASHIISSVVDWFGGIANHVLDPIQKQMDRAQMQNYLKGIDADNLENQAQIQRMTDPRDPVQQAFNRMTGQNPNVTLNGPLRKLTPMEKQAAYTPITPFIPNRDPAAVNYLDAMNQAWREKNPLQSGIQDLATWGALAAASDGTIGWAKVAGDLSKAKAEMRTETPPGEAPPEATAGVGPRPPGPPTGPETSIEATMPRSPTDGTEISPTDLTKVEAAQQAVYEAETAQAQAQTPEGDAALQKANTDLTNLLSTPPFKVTDPDLIAAAQAGEPIFDPGYQASLPGGTKRIVRTTPQTPAAGVTPPVPPPMPGQAPAPEAAPSLVTPPEVIPPEEPLTAPAMQVPGEPPPASVEAPPPLAAPAPVPLQRPGRQVTQPSSSVAAPPRPVDAIINDLRQAEQVKVDALARGASVQNEQQIRDLQTEYMAVTGKSMVPNFPEWDRQNGSPTPPEVVPPAAATSVSPEASTPMDGAFLASLSREQLDTLVQARITAYDPKGAFSTWKSLDDPSLTPEQRSTLNFFRMAQKDFQQTGKADLLTPETPSPPGTEAIPPSVGEPQARLESSPALLNMPEGDVSPRESAAPSLLTQGTDEVAQREGAALVTPPDASLRNEASPEMVTPSTPEQPPIEERPAGLAEGWTKGTGEIRGWPILWENKATNETIVDTSSDRPSMQLYRNGQVITRIPYDTEGQVSRATALQRLSNDYRPEDVGEPTTTGRIGKQPTTRPAPTPEEWARLYSNDRSLAIGFVVVDGKVFKVDPNDVSQEVDLVERDSSGREVLNNMISPETKDLVRAEWNRQKAAADQANGVTTTPPTSAFPRDPSRMDPTDRLALSKNFIDTAPIETLNRLANQASDIINRAEGSPDGKAKLLLMSASRQEVAFWYQFLQDRGYDMTQVGISPSGSSVEYSIQKRDTLKSTVANEGTPNGNQPAAPTRNPEQPPGGAEPTGGTPARPPEPGPKPSGDNPKPEPSGRIESGPAGPIVDERGQPLPADQASLEGLPPSRLPTGVEGGNTRPDREEQGAANAQDGGEPAGRGRGTGDSVGRVNEGDRAVPVVAASKSAAQTRDVSLLALQDELSARGPAARIDDNLNALDLLLKLREEKRLATADEQMVLARYAGWGDSAYEYLFDPNKYVSGATDRLRRERFNTIMAALSDEERNAIGASRRTAFYTTPALVKTIWNGITRLGAGSLNLLRVLEPSAGSGNFFGFMPKDLARKAARTGVELDSVTGSILRNLYQNADVQITGLQTSLLADNGFDVAISNVPFMREGVVDRNPSYMGQSNAFKVQSLHTYFMVKTMDKIRPGGIQAFIVTASAMDSKAHTPVRRYLANQADLLGAFRLPRDIFPDTSVVTDVIFLRKRMPGEKPGDDSWVNSSRVSIPDYVSGRPISKMEKGNYGLNDYFLKNPDNVLGDQVAGRGMYRDQEYLVTRRADVDPVEALNNRIATVLPKNVMQDLAQREAYAYPPTIVNTVKEGAFTIQDDKLLLRRNGRLVDTGLSPDAARRVRDMVGIKSSARDVLQAQLDGVDDAELRGMQKKLRTSYEKFVQKNGPLNSRANRLLMKSDPEAVFLRSLEKWDDKIAETFAAKYTSDKPGLDAGDTALLQAPILTQRNIKPGVKIDRVEDPNGALAASLRERNGVDLGRMSELSGKSEEQLVNELGSRIYKNPSGNYETSEMYLSGNVRQKLVEAQQAAQIDPSYQPNVEALQAVQPADVAYSKIDMRLGAQWIPVQTINQFIQESFGYPKQANGDIPKIVTYNGGTSEWLLNIPSIQFQSADAIANFRFRDVTSTEMQPNGIPKTTRFGGYSDAEMLQFAINNVEPVVRVPESRTNPMTGVESIVNVVNGPLTRDARKKVNNLRQAFEKWIWSDPERTTTIAGLFNERFNYYRDTQWDGSHLTVPGTNTLPGSNPEISLMPHQLGATWRILQGDNTLLAHEVGFGKTYIMQAAGMESRRLGLAKKNAYVMPGHLVENFVDNFQKFYPNASILVPELGADQTSRTLFTSQIATGDWDAIIIPESQLTLIPTSPESRQRFLTSQINELKQYQDEAKAVEEKAKDKSRGRTSKKLQAEIDKMTVRLEKIDAEIAQRQDNTLYWEDLGIDQIFVDEADRFKNLYFMSRMENVKGFSRTYSERSQDLFLKVQHTTDKNNGRGVVFATGTPISNSIAELWTMMRYLMPKKLQELGIANFDAFRSQFATTSVKLGKTVSGTYAPVVRFDKFLNAPELSKIFREVADIKMSEDNPNLEKMKPRLRDGKRVVVGVEADDPLIAFMQTLPARAEAIKKNKEVTLGMDTHLNMTADGKKSGVDLSSVIRGVPENPRGKLAIVAENVAKIYREEQADKGAQAIFLDFGVPRTLKEVQADQRAKRNDALKRGYNIAQVDAAYPTLSDEVAADIAQRTNLYQKLKTKLMAQGIPEKEIAFIQSAKNAEQKDALFQKVRDGEIRVLIGSTEMMGAGSNFQDRLAALHHVDTPWRPRDIEQREGRILRQGNDVYGPKYKRDRTTGQVEILDPGRGVNTYAYITKRSMDDYAWNGIARKQRSIKSIMKGDSTVRSVEEADELVISDAEIGALASGDPIIWDRIQALGNLEEKTQDQQAANDSQISARVTINNAARDNQRLAIQTERIQPLIDAAEKNPRASPFVLNKDMVNRKENVTVAPADLKDVNTLPSEKMVAIINDAPIDTDTTDRRVIPFGKYRGFNIAFAPLKMMSRNELFEAGKLIVSHENDPLPSTMKQVSMSGIPYEVTDNFDLASIKAGSVDLVTRLNNIIGNFAKQRDANEAKIAENNRNAEGAKYTLANGGYKNAPIIDSLQNAIAKIESHMEGREVLDEAQSAQLRSDLEKLYKDEYVKIDPPTERVEGLGQNDENVDASSGGPSGRASAGADDVSSDSNIQEVNAGFDPRPFIKKYPLLATGIIGAGVFAVIGAPQQQEDTRTGKDSLAGIEFVPQVKKVLDFGQAQGLKFSLGQVIKGLNTYNDKYLPVEAELAATVVEAPFSMASKALGATPANVKPGFFDVNQPAYLQGFNWTADNATVQMLQQRWQKRSDRNPTLAFLTTLVADPMNWVGWGEAEDASRTAKILSDIETAQNPVSKANGTFFTRLSQSAISKNREADFGMAFYREARTADADPTAVMERIDQAVRNGNATDAQMRLANLWGDKKEVNQDSVRRLQKYMGILDPKDLTQEEIRTISDRVQGKARWTQADIKWLDKTFDYPVPPMGRRAVKQYQNLQIWAAEHGVPDLTNAIDKSAGADVRSWMRQTMYKVREKYPPEKSPLTAWMEERPITNSILAAGRVLQPGADALNKHVGLPLVLSYLAAPGWPLHAATELALRGMLGPKTAGSYARAAGETVKALASGHGITSTPWYHNQEAARKTLALWYPTELLEGRGGFATMPLTNNPLKRSPIPLLGGGINKVVADAMRAMAQPASAQPGVDALAAVRKEYAAATAEGRGVNQELIQSLVGPKQSGAVKKAYNVLTNMVEHANFGSLYGLNQYMVGKMEGSVRTYYIAQEHERILPTVIDVLGANAKAAKSMLAKISEARPAGVSDATWNRVQSAVQGVLTKGGVRDVVEDTLRGQIDRLNLAKTIFNEAGIPYPVQAEWFMAMRHWTPEDLQAYFTKGGAAEKVLGAGLDFMYGNRLKPLIEEIMNRKFDWNTVVGRREGWKALEAELETNITANRDIWTWAKAIAPTMQPDERSAMYNQVRRIRQEWLTRQRVEQNQARRMFENTVRRERGIATVPDRVFELQDRQFGELMKTFNESDSLMASYWADEASKGRGDPAAWKKMREAQDALWKDYRNARNDFENEKNQIIEQFYAQGQAGNATPSRVMPIPGLRDVTPEQKQIANDALNRVRSYLGGYTQRASVMGKEGDALRTWAEQVDNQIKQLPPDALAQIDKAHEATARIVTENMRSRFVDHLNQTELDAFMHKFLPFWMYDTHGGAFYLWMAGHVPGVYTTADRFIDQTQGTGYLQGGMNPVGQNVTSGVIPSEDFGVFGNQVNPFRGMWPNRLLTFTKQLQQSRPATAQEAMQTVFKDIGQQGILGAHMHPLIEVPLELAQGQNPTSVLPQAVNQMADVNAMAGGSIHPLGLRTGDPFLEYHIQEELFSKGISPSAATPEQRKDAEHAVAIRDFAGSMIPRFTYTTPEKLQERADFQDALAQQGFSKKDQADMIAKGFSPWSLLNSQQKRALMHDHPDWQYLFEANDAFKTPEEKVASAEIRTYLNQLTDISKDRYTTQVTDDNALKQGDITPREWMDQHTKHNDFTAGERSRLGKMLAGAKANLDDPTRRRLLTPEDQAVSDYYAKQAQWIKDNTSNKGGPTSPLNVVDWSAVNDQEKAYMAGLNPQISQYVQQEIQKNQTETEKMWHQALDELDQYNQIPRWIGITPDQAQQRVQQETTYTRLAATDPKAAAIYRATHPLLSRRLPRNPARDQFVLQHPVLEAWFVPPTAKKMALTGNELNRDAFGSLVSVPWEDSPGAGGPPAQTSTLDLAGGGA
jgi:N12 class adenine-specific DNA methylase